MIPQREIEDKVYLMTQHNSKRRSKKSRQTRVEEGNKRIIKDKFEEERRFPPIVAKTEKQKLYLDHLNTKQVIVAEGLFGTGKTFLAACVAADKFRNGEIDKIIVARPYVQTGKTAGYRPGSTLEKLYPYVRNVLDTVKQRLGYGAYEVALKDGLRGQIEVQAVEDIRGRSFDEPCYIIIDESQQTTPEEMESIVTRISDNAVLILCGHEGQKDINGESGLMWFKKFAKRHNLSNVGFVDFNEPEDIVRSGIVKEIAFGLAKDRGEL